MGAVATQTTMAKRRLGKVSWHLWQKGHHNPERNSFRAAWCIIVMKHHDSSGWSIMIQDDDTSWFTNDEPSRFIMMNHHDASASWFIMIYHDESSWFITTAHQEESWWFVMMIHHDSSWWFRWWFNMKHHAALKGFLSGLSWLFFAWAPWHVSTGVFLPWSHFAMALKSIHG